MLAGRLPSLGPLSALNELSLLTKQLSKKRDDRWVPFHWTSLKLILRNHPIAQQLSNLKVGHFYFRGSTNKQVELSILKDVSTEPSRSLAPFCTTVEG